MRNLPTLFSKGHPLKAEPGLSHVLEGHKASIIKKIKEISKLEQLTAEFLDKLVAEAIVDPVTIHFDKQTGVLETAKVNVNEWVPMNSMAGRMVAHGEDVTDLCGGNMKQMARVSIPFSGSGVLLKFAPASCGTTHPFGEIVGDTIQFGFVMLDASDSERNRVKGQIRGNLEQLKNYADQNNQQVKRFNESLPDAVTGAFKQKLEELQKQYSIFGDLGIPLAANKVEPTDAAESEARPRGKARPRQPITYINNVFVESLMQINYNAGDVNNAIQSN